MKKRGQYTSGFTVVELLIVIAVIGIIASISLVAYRGVQGRARDVERKAAVVKITDALELYYLDNGTYPVSSGSTKINNSWSSSSDASWAAFEAQLVPEYMPEMPQDPRASTSTPAAISGGYNFDYFRMTNGWCGSSASKPGFLIAYRYETNAQENKIEGNCPGTQPMNYSYSEYVRAP